MKKQIVTIDSRVFIAKNINKMEKQTLMREIKFIGLRTGGKGGMWIYKEKTTIDEVVKGITFELTLMILKMKESSIE